MAYTQENRLIAINTPLGEDVLLLQGFTGHEGISRPFNFHLELLSEKNTIDFQDIVGKNVTISVTLADESKRYFNGFVSRFAQRGNDERFTYYQAEMVPWLWFLTRTADCRIFQNMSVKDIITKVFDDAGFSGYKMVTQASYDKLEYCVQYRETAFNFVSRLMEQYGIFYFFEHTDGDHTLVMADAVSALNPCPGQPKARYDRVVGGAKDEDVVTAWQLEQELRTGKCSLTDYNFETPSTDLLAWEDTIVKVGGNTKYELFDYPGDYSTKPQGKTLAKIRMEEEEATHLVATGSSNCRAFTSGYTFDLEDHYRSDMNQPYLLTDIQHLASVKESYATGEGGSEGQYSNHFSCTPQNVAYRPPRVTPKPFVQGPQTAVVVGKSGEEIWVDPYGRVKVQFYWDRKGTGDENSSCWVRVSQLWAGKTWGAMFIPRMGQEVIVDFLEGDPDRPIITGRVYNADQIVPGTLPDDQTVSGIRTHSTKGGGDHNANVIAFRDKMGEEEFYMRAEKDMFVRVEHDDELKVQNDQTIEIENNRTEQVNKGDEKITIKQGNRTVEISMGKETLTVGQGDREVNVNTGNDTHNVKMANREVNIKMGNDTLKISMGNQSTKLDLGASTTEAMQSIELKVGQSSVKVDQMGVTIQGMMISIQGQIQVQVKGLMTQVNADAMLMLKGGITMIN
jgi:type VI secretion system secreted protein VgrG